MENVLVNYWKNSVVHYRTLCYILLLTRFSSEFKHASGTRCCMNDEVCLALLMLWRGSTSGREVCDGENLS